MHSYVKRRKEGIQQALTFLSRREGPLLVWKAEKRSVKTIFLAPATGLSSVVIIKGRHTRSRLRDTIGFPSLIMAIIHKRTLEPLSVGGYTTHPQAPDKLYQFLM